MTSRHIENHQENRDEKRYRTNLRACSVVSENDSFSVDVNGTVTDTRLNSAPDGYSPSGTCTNAEQIVPDISSVQTMPCATELMPTGGGEYSYNPTYWNDEANVYRSNCYGYALNLIATNTSDPYAGWLFQPGYKAGEKYTSFTKTAKNFNCSIYKPYSRTINESKYNAVSHDQQWVYKRVWHIAYLYFFQHLHLDEIQKYNQ